MGVEDLEEPGVGTARPHLEVRWMLNLMGYPPTNYSSVKGFESRALEDNAGGKDADSSQVVQICHYCGVRA